MFNKNLVSFFVDEGKIKFIRVLIALLSIQLVLFAIGALLYFLTTLFIVDEKYFFDFFTYLKSFFSFLYNDVVKNGILISTLLFILLTYELVKNYNKATIHYSEMRASSKLFFLIVALIFYSIFMVVQSGFFRINENHSVIKSHYYYYIVFIMALFNFANIFSLITLFLDKRTNEKELAKKPRVVLKTLKIFYTGFIFIAVSSISIKYITLLSGKETILDSFLIIGMFILIFLILRMSRLAANKVLSEFNYDMYEQYINTVKEELGSIELFKEVKDFNDLRFGVVNVEDVRISDDHVKQIKEKGCFNQLIMVSFRTREKLNYAIFDKKGNLIIKG